MSELHKVFQIDEDVEIRWATSEPKWIEDQDLPDDGPVGIEKIWESIPLEWICTFTNLQSAAPFFGYFSRESFISTLYSDLFEKTTNMSFLAKAIAQLRWLQHSDRIFCADIPHASREIGGAAIAAYKTSPVLRHSFPLLENYLNKSMPQGGYVYLLSDQLGHYKIGHTSNLDRRLGQLRTQPPFDIIPVASMWVPDRVREEKALHEQHAQYRLRGEWFALPQTAIDHIVAWMKAIEDGNKESLRAYNDFNPADWHLVEVNYRDWTAPRTPSAWEEMIAEKEQE